jgi:hypothetical protein
MINPLFSKGKGCQRLKRFGSVTRDGFLCREPHWEKTWSFEKLPGNTFIRDTVASVIDGKEKNGAGFTGLRLFFTMDGVFLL